MVAMSTGYISFMELLCKQLNIPDFMTGLVWPSRMGSFVEVA